MGSIAGSSAGATTSPVSLSVVSSTIKGAVPIFPEGSTVGSIAGSSAGATTSSVLSIVVSACASWLLTSSTGPTTLLSGARLTGSEPVGVGTNPVVAPGVVFSFSRPEDSSTDTSSLWTSVVFASVDVVVLTSSASSPGHTTSKLCQA